MRKLMIVAILAVLATGGTAFAVDQASQTDWATPYQPGLYMTSPDAKTAVGQYDFQANDFSNTGTYGTTDRYGDVGAQAAITIPPQDLSPVPEPASMVLFGFGLAGAAAAYRRRRAK